MSYTRTPTLPPPPPRTCIMTCDVQHGILTKNLSTSHSTSRCFTTAEPTRTVHVVEYKAACVLMLYQRSFYVCIGLDDQFDYKKSVIRYMCILNFQCIIVICGCYVQSVLVSFRLPLV